jgi:Holliday junction resolvase RusA-like endonuclease
VNAETMIRLTAAQLFPAPYDGPVSIDVLAVFAPPASWSKAKTNRTLGKLHIQRPDFDNLQKTICDALSGVAYRDDGQIGEARCRKVWGQVAKTVITVRALEVDG